MIDRNTLPKQDFPLEEFEADLKRDEGYKLVPYKDSRGKWTVGIGHYIGLQLTSQFAARKPISTSLVDFLFREDINEVLVGLDRLVPWWRTLSPVRQRVLANMAFNMGLHTLATFGETLDLVEAGDYGEAGDHMVRSRWAKQVGERATRLADMMRDDYS